MLRSATTHPQQLAGTTPSLLAVRPSCDESVNVNTTDATTGKKTPGGAGTHTGHTGHADAQRHTDHTDEPHNHPNPVPTTHTQHVSATTEAAADSPVLRHCYCPLRIHTLLYTVTGKKSPRGAAGTHTGKKTVQGPGEAQAVRTRKKKCPRLRRRAGRSGGLGIAKPSATGAVCGSRTCALRTTCKTKNIMYSPRSHTSRSATCAAPTLAPRRAPVSVTSTSDRIRDEFG